MAKVGLENDTLKQPKCPSNWEYSTGQRQLLDIQSGEQMDRLSFSAQSPKVLRTKSSKTLWNIVSECFSFVANRYRFDTEEPLPDIARTSSSLRNLVNYSFPKLPKLHILPILPSLPNTHAVRVRWKPFRSPAQLSAIPFSVIPMWLLVIHVGK